MFKVYVSYSLVDEKKLDILKSKLSSHGIDFVLSSASKDPCKTLPKDTIQAIRSSDCVVAIVDSESRLKFVVQEIGASKLASKPSVSLVDRNFHNKDALKSIEVIEYEKENLGASLEGLMKSLEKIKSIRLKALQA